MNKKRICLLILLILVTIGACFATYRLVNRTPNVYYRTYTKENGWSKWSKNGNKSGDGKHDILAIQIKVKAREKGNVYYETYYNGKWHDQVSGGETSGNEKTGIRAFKAQGSDTLYKKYFLEYRFTSSEKFGAWQRASYVWPSKENIKYIELRFRKKVGEKDD